MNSDPIPLLKDLIRRPSVTPAEVGVLAVLEAELDRLGFLVTRLKFEGDGSYPVDNLFAIRGDSGNNGKCLLFGGHTDVVPPGDVADWTHDPFAADEVDGLIYGRGAADMKSGIAAFVTALETAVGSGAADKGTIALAITNDEEADSINGTAKIMAWAEAQGHRFDFAIVGEPSATARVGDSIKVGRRGSFSGRIVVTGAQGHVAYPDRANNPLPVAAALVLALSGKLDDGTEAFQPSNLEFTSVDVGNKAGNVIPAKADLAFNARFNDRWTPESLEAAVREVISGVDAQGCAIDLTVLGRTSRSFSFPIGAGVALLDRVIADRTGTAPQHSTGGGTSDARFIAQYCPVVEFGLPGPTMHKTDEHVAIADVRVLAQLYADFITRFFAEDRL
jgi:succinyl-diaminopimelate desuccinylase